MDASLTPAVTLLVLLAGVLHAIWNAIAKAIPDKMVATGLIAMGCAVGGAIALPWSGFPARAALWFLAGSTLLHFVYFTALMRSYQLGDFGHTYPLARGTAPLLVSIGAWVFASQRLDALEITGVVVIAIGLMSLVFAGGRLARSDLPATIAAGLTGVTIAGYTLMDGLGVRHAHNPTGYIALLFVVQGPILGAVALLTRPRDPSWRSPRITGIGLLAGVLSLFAYGIVIWAQDRSPFALVSALRETSVISAALIAAVVFKETFGWRRVGPACAVALGIVLIAI